MRMVSPHQSLMFAPVTGTVDATYDKDWLTDGQANYPVRKTGALSLAVAPSPAIAIDVIAVCHHNIPQAATIALTGDITSTIPTAAHPADGIPHNWFRLLEAPVAGVDALILGVTGHTDPVLIGELYAGLSFAPELPLRAGQQLSPGQVARALGEFGIVAPYDPGFSPPRGISGELALSDAELASLIEIHLAQRLGSRPVLVIPDDAVNDAWLGLFDFTETRTGGHHFVQIDIVELPRVRWP